MDRVGGDSQGMRLQKSCLRWRTTTPAISTQASQLGIKVRPSKVPTIVRSHSDREKSGGESGLYSHVVSTYLSSTESKSSTSRDVGTAGNLTTLPFTTQTVSLSKENTYSAHGCDQPWNFTITTVDADGTTQHHSGTDSLTVNVPTKQPATVTMANAYDPEFSAHLTYNGALPFLYSRGSSARSESPLRVSDYVLTVHSIYLVANISLEQSFSIGFCPDDD